MAKTMGQGALAGICRLFGITLRDGDIAGFGLDGEGNLLVNNTTNLSAFADTVASYDTTDGIMNGVDLLTPQFATIAVSTSGVTSLVAAAVNDTGEDKRIIRVTALALIANAAVNVKFQSHTTPTDISGLFYLAANGGFVLPYSPKGWFQTLIGEALDINLSGSIAVGGILQYVTVG